MKISAFQLNVYPILFLLIISSCKKSEEELVVRKGKIQGIVKYFETNTPLINREVFLYGRRVGGNLSGNVIIASATTDSSGQYEIDFEFTGQIEDLNLWITSLANENFSGKDENKYKNTEYNLTGYNSCYLQGVIPNTTAAPIEFNTLNHRDIILYPYNTIFFTVINDDCFDFNDRIMITTQNAISSEFSVGITIIGNCDTMNTGTLSIIPPTIVRWDVTKNNITSTNFDTLNPFSCEMLNYTINY
jgi:hypothetical protein